MAEARKAKLSEQTADRLYELIVDEGRYPLGSKLPNENELSQALEVSRTTLREAISFLVARECWRSGGEREPLSRRRCPLRGWT